MLGEDRGQEFTLDKIEDMEIDYPAAMVKRAEVHAQIERELEIKDLARAAKAELVAIQGGKMSAPKTRPVLMAVATKGGGVINEHFGHASEFLIYEASEFGVRFIGHRKTTPYCEGGDTCGDGESALDVTIRELAGCEVVLCSKPPALHPTANTRWKPSKTQCWRCTRKWARPASWKRSRSCNKGQRDETRT
jgi:nitrogen fixation protein NifB